MNLGRLEEARPYLEQALEIRKAALGEEHPYTVVSLEKIGLYYMKEGDFDLAEKYLVRSLTLREKVLGNHPHTARSLNALGELNFIRGELDKAQSYLEPALEIQQEIWPSNHPEKGLTIFNLGKVFWAKNDGIEARSYFKQAKAILKENVATTHFALQQLDEI
jgi:tetratricopeptide (TPR) repeat protein